MKKMRDQLSAALLARSDPEYAHIQFLRHRSPRETEEWLKSLTD